MRRTDRSKEKNREYCGIYNNINYNSINNK